VFFSDLLVAQAIGQQLQNFEFAIGQGVFHGLGTGGSRFALRATPDRKEVLKLECGMRNAEKAEGERKKI